MANDGSQNTGLSVCSQHTPFPARRASTDGARSCTCIALTKAEPCTSNKHALLQTHSGIFAVQGRYKMNPFPSVSIAFLQGVAERPLPCNYNVFQFVRALSRR